MSVEEVSAVGPLSVPTWQYFYKPILADGAKTAVLLMNHGSGATDLTLDFQDISGVKCTTCKLRDIWNHKDLGSFDAIATVAQKQRAARAGGANDIARVIEILRVGFCRSLCHGH